MPLALAIAAWIAAAPPGAASYEDSIRAWRAARVEELVSDTGWLTVAGLFWLHPGENRFGTARSNDIVLPAGTAPPRAGMFVHDGNRTTVRALPGAALRCRGRTIDTLRLRSDAEDSTDVVELGPRLRFLVIRRGGRYAVRMRDLQSPMRQDFHGIDTYPTGAPWRVEARLAPYVPAKKLPIPTVLGTVDSLVSPGALLFRLAGQDLRLDAILEKPGARELFVIFSDATSGEETYPGGRFLYAPLPQDGRTVLDFNKAYNPPCAFTPYATCPLPPRQNELPVAVRAGERTYGEHGEH